MKLSEVQAMYFNGPAGESVFTTPFAQVLDNDPAHELLLKISKAGDERSMVLTTAMVVENYLNTLLAIVLPKYARLTKAKEFTFSSRINTLAALDLVPRHLVRAADLVRQVRNAFAHDLKVEALTDVDAKIVQRMRALYTERKIRSDAGPDDVRNLFSVIAYLATTALYAYRHNLRALNATVRDPAFAEALAASERSIQDAMRERLVARLREEGQ